MEETLGEKIVRSSSQNESFALQAYLNEVEELFTGSSLMQALDQASTNGFADCVDTILNSALFRMLPKEQQNSMISSAIGAASEQSIRDLLESKKSQKGGKRKKMRRTRRRN